MLQWTFSAKYNAWVTVYYLTWVRISGYTLKQYTSPSITEWTIHSVRVTSDPTNVCHTRKYIPRMIVKHILRVEDNEQEEEE